MLLHNFSSGHTLPIIDSFFCWAIYEKVMGVKRGHFLLYVQSKIDFSTRRRYKKKILEAGTKSSPRIGLKKTHFYAFEHVIQFVHQSVLNLSSRTKDKGRSKVMDEIETKERWSRDRIDGNKNLC